MADFVRAIRNSGAPISVIFDMTSDQCIEPFIRNLSG